MLYVHKYVYGREEFPSAVNIECIIHSNSLWFRQDKMICIHNRRALKAHDIICGNKTQSLRTVVYAINNIYIHTHISCWYKNRSIHVKTCCTFFANNNDVVFYAAAKQMIDHYYWRKHSISWTWFVVACFGMHYCWKKVGSALRPRNQVHTSYRLCCRCIVLKKLRSNPQENVSGGPWAAHSFLARDIQANICLAEVLSVIWAKALLLWRNRQKEKRKGIIIITILH